MPIVLPLERWYEGHFRPDCEFIWHVYRLQLIWQQKT